MPKAPLALAKIVAAARKAPREVNPARASAYIVSPLTGRGGSFARLFLTHPPTAERIPPLAAKGDDPDAPPARHA